MKLNPFTFTGIILLLMTHSPFACEYHNAPMFGVMGVGHPMMNRHKSQDFGELVVSHQSTIRISENTPSTLEITYKLPLNYRDMTLEFSSTNGIQLTASEPVKIEKMLGVYRLGYAATDGGSQLINVRVAGMKNGQPYSHIQHVNLIVL